MDQSKQLSRHKYWSMDHLLIHSLVRSDRSLMLRTTPRWARIIKNPDESTGPLARPFARSLLPLTRLLAPDCSLCSRPPLRSLVCLLAHFANSQARGTVNDWMTILSVFFSIFDRSVVWAISGMSAVICQSSTFNDLIS